MKVTQAGEIAIPPPLQKETGIYPGAEVVLSHEDGALVVRRRELDEEARAFLQAIEKAREVTRAAKRTRALSLEDVTGLSRGEQFVRLLADSGFNHMTTDEFMEMMRGPYDDVHPR